MHSTSHCLTSLFLKPQHSVTFFVQKLTQHNTLHISQNASISLGKKQNYIHNFATQTQKNNNTCSGTYYIFRWHSPREPASVVCNYEQGDLLYSVGPHRNQCQPQPTQKKLGGVLEKNAGEWTRRVEISKGEIRGSRRSMRSYIRTCSRLRRRTFELWVLNRWVLNFCVCSTPVCGYQLVS